MVEYLGEDLMFPSRSPLNIPQGYSFHTTIGCNSRQFLIAKGLRLDVLLAVLANAHVKLPHRLYGPCLMTNYLHLLIRPEGVSRLARLRTTLVCFSNGTKPPCWALRALLGGTAVRHCH